MVLPRSHHKLFAAGSDNCKWHLIHLTDETLASEKSIIIGIRTLNSNRSARRGQRAVQVRGSLHFAGENVP